VAMSMETVTLTSIIERPEKEPEDAPPVPELLALQKDRLRTTEALEAARLQAQDGRFDEAQKAVRFAKEELLAQGHAGHAYSRALQQDLDMVMDGVQSSSTWASRGSKHAGQAYLEHRAQRGAADWTGRETAYSNTRQCAMKAAATPQPEPQQPQQPQTEAETDATSSSGFPSQVKKFFFG